jgi:hypothetical protein
MIKFIYYELTSKRLFQKNSIFPLIESSGAFSSIALASLTKQREDGDSG